MSVVSTITGNYNNSLQTILNSIFQKSGLTTSSAGSSFSTASAAAQSDSQQLSPLAQMMQSLQQLQQSNPTKYQQVTQQIATNLQSAAQTEKQDGDSDAATVLNQLATEFTDASKNGELPSTQGLTESSGGHRHHHAHGSSGSASSASSSSGTSASSVSSNSSGVSQYQAAMQSSQAESGSQSAASIIMQTLSKAGN